MCWRPTPGPLATSSWANTQYDIFGRNVTRFFQLLSPEEDGDQTQDGGLCQAMGLRGRRSLPEGMRAREAQLADKHAAR